MAQPIFKIGDHDYTEYIARDGLKPSRNDLDKNGSGRNLINGLMYRTRIATKMKYSVQFNRMDAATLKQLENDMSGTYVKVTLLEGKTNRHVTRNYYTSTINEGVQRFVEGETYYDGVAFDITER